MLRFVAFAFVALLPAVAGAQAVPAQPALGPGLTPVGAEQAANTLAEVKIRQLARHGKQLTAEEVAAIREPVVAEFKRKSSAYYSTSEIWDDGILDPVDTRNALGIAISAALNTPIGDPRYGIFRM